MRLKESSLINTIKQSVRFFTLMVSKKMLQPAGLTLIIILLHTHIFFLEVKTTTNNTTQPSTHCNTPMFFIRVEIWSNRCKQKRAAGRRRRRKKTPSQRVDVTAGNSRITVFIPSTLHFYLPHINLSSPTH